jgi:hypothetical protein
MFTVAKERVLDRGSHHIASLTTPFLEMAKSVKCFGIIVYARIPSEAVIRSGKRGSRLDHSPILEAERLRYEPMVGA